MHLTFVLVDARPSARAALREVVEEQWGWSVIGEASDGFEAVAVARRADADVLLVDAAVDGLDLKSLNELIDPAVGPLVVGLLDFPHQHAAAKGVAVMKGAPPEHVRNVIIGALSSAGTHSKDEGGSR